ncbi:MAG: UDP-N-acetylmuramate--L-alanine ligase [Bacteroidia bacterium]|nr:UDP-N-acetylmuramate--L-alanine ligase [Bacteroidia bacterium]NNM21943.1 UDP-N-acetylmuramate--L-alanine ligase [Flavobacteriaceae bacterium]
MNALKDISQFYFVGIGGIGMSALARYMNLLGKQVQGYDRSPTKLTNELIREGMDVTFIDEVSNVERQLKPEETLVVYTPAIPDENNILRYFRENNYKVVKRAKLLGDVTRDTFCLAVAGTHGKTTTSAILGHLLAECDMPVTAFLGGIAENYDSNFISKGTEITVVEADEFDRSFLQLRPDVACITSTDADHLDIYGNATSLEDSFREFARLIPKKENLFYKKGLDFEGQSVGINEPANFEARNIKIDDGEYMFDLVTPNGTIEDLRFLIPGHHNLQNAVTALGMAISAGTPTPCLPKALQSFRGVQRRFSYRIKSSDLVVIDDYAHHPTEINALHQAVSEMYPEDRKLIVFQPHLFSRTRDFMDGFAESLSKFDEVLLLDIYPAREMPITGIDSQELCRRITVPSKQLVTKAGLPEMVQNSRCRVKLLVGAGDIGEEVDKIVKFLQDEG